MGPPLISKNLIVTGSPGVGKTTLLKECAYPLADHLGGFFTEEVREGKDRKGFLLKTFSGQAGLLASKDSDLEVKVNKYGVDVSVLDDLGVPAVREAMRSKKVVVVDEIGTMEMLSPLFCETVAAALIGEKSFLATIRLQAEPFTSQIKKMSDTVLIKLDRSNFPEVKQRVRAWLEEKCLDSSSPRWRGPRSFAEGKGLDSRFRGNDGL